MSADRTNYSQNAAKTNDGEFISSYECDPKTADEEFLLPNGSISILPAEVEAQYHRIPDTPVL